jgi:hypothetical protein
MAIEGPSLYSDLGAGCRWRPGSEWLRPLGGIVSITEAEQLARIRHRIFQSWSLNEYNLPADLAKQIMNDWHDIRNVESIGSWSAVTMMSGRMAEGLLTGVLLTRGANPAEVGGYGIGRLINIAEHDGFLMPRVMSRGARGVSQHARRLRNWAAHFNPGASHTTDLTATQALACLVTFSEVLLFRPRRHGFRRHAVPDAAWLEMYWRRVRPRTLIATLDDIFSKGLTIPSFVSGDCREFYEQTVPYMSMRSLSRLIFLVRRWDLPIDGLLDTIDLHFVDVLRNFAWSSARGASDLQSQLRGLGLRAHGRVLGIMLPADTASLLEMLKHKNVHASARYVSGIATANKDLFHTITAGIRDIDPLIDEAWRGYNGKTSYVANRIAFFRRFPLRIRKALISRAPPGAIEAWALVGIPYLAVQTLAILYSDTDNGEAGQERREELRQLASARLSRARVHELRNLPYVLWRSKITDRSVFGRHLLRSLTNRAFVELEQTREDEHAALRILFDVSQTSQRYQDVVRNRLTLLLSENVGPSVSWDYWTCCGLIRALGGSAEPALPPSIEAADRDILPSWLQTATPHEAALAVIGADHVGVNADKLPDLLLNFAMEATAEEGLELSSDVIETLMDMCDRLSDPIAASIIPDEGMPLMPLVHPVDDPQDIEYDIYRTAAGDLYTIIDDEDTVDLPSA